MPSYNWCNLELPLSASDESCQVLTGMKRFFLAWKLFRADINVYRELLSRLCMLTRLQALL